MPLMMQTFERTAVYFFYCYTLHYESDNFKDIPYNELRFVLTITNSVPRFTIWSKQHRKRTCPLFGDRVKRTLLKK